ncbi:MAG: hypothetical protein AB7P02_12625 [Alphaproteobacteria bacterium]
MPISTAERVTRHTDAVINRRIRRATAERLAQYAGRPAEIEERLAALDREWDIERAIEANAAALALLGVILGARRDRRWFALPGLVSGFLFQHAVEGWCPPVPVLRRLGFRTAEEIAEERYGLRVLRGDFDPPAEGQDRLPALLRALWSRKRVD